MSPPNWPWAQRFAELALRACRRIHLEYGAIAMGHQWHKNSPALSQLNHGLGIACADELTVCAAIAHECLASQGFSGAWVHADPDNLVDGGPRHWRIDREQYYSDGSKRVDFVVERVEALGAATDGAALRKWPPCYVEAKRVRRWRIESYAKPDCKPSSKNLDEIKKDIAKLRSEIEQRSGEGAFAHLLLWDVFEHEEDGPEPVLKALGDDALRLHQIRWMPIGCSGAGGNAPTSPPTVTQWLWLALVSVDPLSNAQG